MSELTLVGLRVVLEVARTGSFSAAAERLEYTQSAVSRQVAVTEKAAGAPLFERHARGVRLTAAGEVLVRHAGRVLDGVAAASQELAGLRDRLAGRLVVGGFPTATAALLLAATVFAHDSAAFGVHVLAGAGVDLRLSCRVGSGYAEEAGERGDGFEEQGVSAGLLVGGAAGAELGDGAAVLGLGGELADPGGHGGVLEGRRAAGRGAASRG